MPAASTTTATSTEPRTGGRWRVLVGGIGYRFLRDGSIGPTLIDQLEGSATEEIEFEDTSYGPVGLTQNLEARPPYDRVVLFGSMARGRAPGAITSYQWNWKLPPADEIQDRVAEAVTGVISLENHLIVCSALGGLPEDVRVIEIEPADEGWGEGFSPIMEERIPDVLEAIWTSTKP